MNILGFVLLVVISVQSFNLEEPPLSIPYERSYMDAINDNEIFSQLVTVLHDSPSVVHLIDGSFYDNHLVSRFTSQWLAGNTTWVIGITRDEPNATNFQVNLVGKSVIALSKVYGHNETLRFGLVDYYKDEEIKESLVGMKAPKIVMIHDGLVYQNNPFQEGYNRMYEFIQGGWQSAKFPPKPISGRLTVVGLYWAYIWRGL